jgi:hypothetical protein
MLRSPMEWSTLLDCAFNLSQKEKENSVALSVGSSYQESEQEHT